MVNQYQEILDKIKVLDSNMIPLRSHLKGIADYFYSKQYPFFIDVGNWFWIPSSINSVDFDGIKYDAAFTWCSPAFEYETEKQKLHSRL